MGCTGKLYSSDDNTILAVSPARYQQWPCGTQLIITGPANPLDPLVVVRQDACPGCHPNTVDLSEAGVLIVCGGIHSCQVTIQKLVEE